jgi:hypothetical protein
MKSRLLLIAICFIFISLFNPCKSEDIYGKAELTTIDEKLIFKIMVFNNSENDIYIPLTYWIFHGDTSSDKRFMPYQSFFINKISYLKSKYKDFDEWFDGGFDNSFLTKVPSFMVVHPKDSSYLRIKVIVSYELLSKFLSDPFNFQITIAYGDDESLFYIGEIIDCELLQVEEEELSPMIVIESGKKQDEWYKFNDYVDCELDKQKSKIFSIGFLKKILIKTQLTLPVIERK